MTGYDGEQEDNANADSTTGMDSADLLTPTNAPPVKAYFNTQDLSTAMKALSLGHKSFQGLTNYGCMSTEMKKAFFFLNMSQTRRFLHIIVIKDCSLTGIQHNVCGNFDPETADCLLVVWNWRHVVTARRSRQHGIVYILDTSAKELPTGHAKLMKYLQEKRVFGDWKVQWDQQTPQQPLDRGGCCVMSLCNYNLPPNTYATVEDGEVLRKVYGQKILEKIQKQGYSPEYLAQEFDALFEMTSFQVP